MTPLSYKSGFAGTKPDRENTADPIQLMDLSDVQGTDDIDSIRVKMNTLLALMRPIRGATGMGGIRVHLTQGNMIIEQTTDRSDDNGSEDEEKAKPSNSNPSKAFPSEASDLGDKWAFLSLTQRDEALRSAICAIIYSINNATGSCVSGVPTMTFPQIPTNACASTAVYP